MREIAYRLVTFQALNDHSMIHAGLVLVWVILLIATVMSLRQQPWSPATKGVWLGTILLVPIIGLATYALRCLLTSDFGFLRFILGPSKSTRQIRG